MPCQAEFILLLSNKLLLLGSYGFVLGGKSSFIISGAILFLTLKISVARACIFLWWLESELSFFNRSIQDNLSPYVIVNAHSCKACILLLRPLLWSIQAKGQCPNWDVTNAFIIFSFFFPKKDACIEQLLLMHWTFDLLFYRGCLCGFQKIVLNPKLYLVVHS